MQVDRSLSVLAIALMLASGGCGYDSRTAQLGTAPTNAKQPTEPTKLVEQEVNLLQLEIPKREHGYQNFDARLLTSEAELEAFIADVKSQDGWNNREAFVSGLRADKLDYAKSALLLLRHTEGSGSVRVWLEPAVTRGEELVVAIGKEVPSMGTNDMAYYCFALVVPLNAAKRVRIRGSFTPSRHALNEEGQETLLPWSLDDIVFEL